MIEGAKQHVILELILLQRIHTVLIVVVLHGDALIRVRFHEGHASGRLSSLLCGGSSRLGLVSVGRGSRAGRGLRGRLVGGRSSSLLCLLHNLLDLAGLAEIAADADALGLALVHDAATTEAAGRGALRLASRGQLQSGLSILLEEGSGLARGSRRGGVGGRDDGGNSSAIDAGEAVDAAADGLVAALDDADTLTSDAGGGAGLLAGGNDSAIVTDEGHGGHGLVHGERAVLAEEALAAEALACTAGAVVVAVVGAVELGVAVGAGPIGLALALALEAGAVDAALSARLHVAGSAGPAVDALTSEGVFVAGTLAGAVVGAAALGAGGAEEEGGALALSAGLLGTGVDDVGTVEGGDSGDNALTVGVVAVALAVVGTAVSTEVALVALAETSGRAHTMTRAVIGAALQLARGTRVTLRVDALADTSLGVAESAAVTVVLAEGHITSGARPTIRALAATLHAYSAIVAVILATCMCILGI